MRRQTSGSIPVDANQELVNEHGRARRTVAFLEIDRTFAIDGSVTTRKVSLASVGEEYSGEFTV
jgi:hypothetical protein